jgi:hypothetical protein
MITKLCRTILTLSVAAGAVLGSSQAGRAQAIARNQSSPYQTITPAPVQPQAGSQPLFTFGGVGVYVRAPVAAPYNGAGTYENFAGQPAVRGNSFLAQAMRGDGRG